MYTLRDSVEGYPLSWNFYNGQVMSMVVHKYDWVHDRFFPLTDKEMDQILIPGGAPVSVCWWEGSLPVSAVANWSFRLAKDVTLGDIVDVVYHKYIEGWRSPKELMFLDAIHVDTESRTIYIDFRGHW